MEALITLIILGTWALAFILFGVSAIFFAAVARVIWSYAPFYFKLFYQEEAWKMWHEMIETSKLKTGSLPLSKKVIVVLLLLPILIAIFFSKNVRRWSGVDKI